MFLRNAQRLPLFLCALGCMFPAPSHAQDRSRMTVYVPMPTGGTLNQRAYFQDNFRMELIGANYPAVDTRADSLYTLLLTIEDNSDFDPSMTADDSNPRYLLRIKLERSVDNLEIISFSFFFNDVESMADWNLYLLYQVLANAYVPPEEQEEPPPPVKDDRWRNKWLYLNAGAGLDLGYFLQPGSNTSRQSDMFMGARLEIEAHILNVLSVSLFPIKAAFLHDGANLIPSPGFGVALKAVIKPGDYLMLEPYVGGEYSLSLEDLAASRLLALAGIQFGLRGGLRGAITLDFGASYSMMGKLRMADGSERDMLTFSLLGGYKVGFWDRKKK